MNNALQTLNYQEHPIRMVEKDGAPWWVLADVCRVLNLSNSRRVAERLDADEKGVTLGDTPGGPQNMTIINESGLYSVILRSDKPEAKAFKRWVTHEVLPSIRKTGMYAPSLEGTVRDLSERVTRLEQAGGVWGNGSEPHRSNRQLPGRLEPHPISSTTAQLLWYTLQQLDQLQRCLGEVQIDNLELARMMNVRTERTIATARKKLIDAGYITFVPGVKGRPSVYHLREDLL